jgi:hypothetical protein
MDKLKISTVAACIAGSMLSGTAPSFGAQRNVWGMDMGSRITSEATMPAIPQNSYSFEGMVPVESWDLRNYDFLKKLGKCFVFPMNLSRARFSDESISIDFKKATMILSWKPIWEGLLEGSEISSEMRNEFTEEFYKSPITLEEFLKKHRGLQNISESTINNLSEKKDPFAYFVENRNRWGMFRGEHLDPIRVLVLDIFEGNRFGLYKNFFQKLTVYDTNGSKVELEERGYNNDNRIRSVLEGKDICMIANNQRIRISEWKKDYKNKKLLFFITYRNGLYSLEYSGNGGENRDDQTEEHSIDLPMDDPSEDDNTPTDDPSENDNTITYTPTTTYVPTPTDEQQADRGMLLENVINRWFGNNKNKNQGMFLENVINRWLGNK